MISKSNAKLRKISIQTGTILLSAFLLVRCGIPKKEVEINLDNLPSDETLEEIEEETFDLEDKVLLVTFDDRREVKNNIYTNTDLEHINSLIIRVDDNFDYNFLNNLSNVEFLQLDDYSEGKSLRVVEGSNFKDNISIAITMDPKVGKFEFKRYPFLGEIKSIDKLLLGSENVPLDIDNDYLEELKNVHNLYLSVDKYTNVDYDDLEYLDSLSLDGDTKYVDQDDIEDLKEEGVKVMIKK